MTSRIPVMCAITGASGYVGSRIVACFFPVLDVVPMGRNVGSGGIRWQMDSAADIAEELKVRGVTVLVHAAWDFGHRKAADNWKSNVDGSRSLIEAAIVAGVQRIVLVSTISAFSGARSEYGRSKLAVERMVLEAGGTVIRPGLVWGDRPGGMFGSLREQVKKGGVVPVIGDGRFAQYLVHEDDLANVVLRAAQGEFAGRILTVANPRPWLLRDLVLRMAEEAGKTVKLIGVPWRVIYSVLRTAEFLGLKLSFRSDSVISLVYQDPAPQIALDLPVREFK
jgi:nucleoside-diphosphate-sugar epimerase